MSTVAALDILRHDLVELNLGFIHSALDTLLHDEAKKERPLLETLCDL